MKWHYIQLVYPKDLTEDQENILIVNWRSTMEATKKALEVKYKKACRLGKAYPQEARAQVESLITMCPSLFRLNKSNNRIYSLLISDSLFVSAEAIPVVGKLLMQRDSTIKKLANCLVNDVAQDQGIKGRVECTTGVENE